MDRRRYLALQGDGIGPFPAPPSRTQACRIRLSFSGLIVSTQQYGVLPWYDMALFALTNPADRGIVYAGKRGNGDRHCLMSFDPDEGGYVNRHGKYKDILIPYSHMLHPDLMRRDTREVITNGFTPLVNLGCDREDNVPYFQNAIERLLALHECLKDDPADLRKYVVVMPGWDGTFYGWEPAELQEFGRIFRDLWPDGYLACEHDPGHIPCGGGAGDYDPDSGRMKDYDILLSEFNYPINPDTPDFSEQMQQVWQVALRLLGPAWVRPDDADDYMTTEYAINKWYLGAGSTRGRYFPCAFEWSGGTLRWTNTPDDQLIAVSQDNARERAYFSALGYGDCTG